MLDESCIKNLLAINALGVFMWVWTWFGLLFYRVTWEDIFATCLPGSQGIGGIPPGYVGC